MIRKVSYKQLCIQIEAIHKIKQIDRKTKRQKKAVIQQGYMEKDGDNERKLELERAID